MRQPFKPGMGVIEMMKAVMKQAGELLTAEATEKALTELNRKIASSLQYFIVRVKFYIYERFSQESHTQLGSQLRVETDVSAIRLEQVSTLSY
jgi:hypothetical protein